MVAGTALPDWMNIIDRKNRARKQYAEPLADDPDAIVAAVARGCIQHHVDDDWFHQSATFVALSTKFAVEVRGQLEGDLGHQAGFVGHISVEMLLDWVLFEREPGLLDGYYQTLSRLDPVQVQVAASRICARPVTKIPVLLPKFIDARFLADYDDDTLMLEKLNGVMRRVKLPALPDRLVDWVGSAREEVSAAADQLLTPDVDDGGT